MDLIIPDSVRSALVQADEDNTPTAEVKDLAIPESVMASLGRDTSDIVIPESVYEIIDSEETDFFDGLKGLAIEAGEGLTFGALGELAAMAQAATSDDTYEEAKAEYEEARRKFKEENPNLAEYALPLELIASIPTGIGFFKTLGKIGVKSAVKSAGIEAATYGALSGEGAEDRVIKAVTGGALGLAGGKIIDVATGAVKTAGRKLKDRSDAKRAEREKDIELEEDLGFDPDADNVTLIERVPEGEETPYTVLGSEPYQPITFETKAAAGPPKPRQKLPTVSFGNTRLSAKTQEAAKKLVGSLLPDANGALRVISGSEYLRLAKKYSGNISRIARDLKTTDEVASVIQKKYSDIFEQPEGYGLRGISFGNGTVFVNDIGSDSLGTATTLFHEMGHEAARLNLGKELKEHIGDWNNRFAFSGEGGRLRLTPQTKLGDEIAEEWNAYYNTLSENYYNYAEKDIFDEWLADSISVWHTKNTLNIDPKTTLESWFSQQAKKIKDMWEKIVPPKARKMSTAEKAKALNKFFDEFAERSRVFVEGERPTVRGITPSGPMQRSAGGGRVVTPAYREATRPKFTQTVAGPEMGPSWRDATTAGELFDGIKSGLARTYLRLKPMTDLLQSRVSRGVGALAQRADEAATRTSQLEFETFVQPIQKIAEEWDNNKVFRENTLLLSEGSQRMSREKYLSYIQDTFGEDAKKNMARYLAWSKKKNIEFNERFSMPKSDDYLHRQRRYSNNKEYNAAIEDEFTLPVDPALKKRRISVHDKVGKGGNSRLIDGTDVADYYQNVFLTNSRRIMNNEKLLEYGKKFGVKGDGRSLSAEQIMQKLRQELRKRGIDSDRADFAVQEIKRNLLGERKSMNQVLQALQTLGYGGSLAGFKSALLNMHDVPQTAVTQGPMALRSWFKNIVKDKNGKMLSDSFGFSQQAKFGEFANSMQQTLSTPGGTAKSLNNTANKTTNTLMKLSLFQMSDKIGKGGVLRAVQQRAVDDVERNGVKALKAKWGDYFSDYELRKMANDLQKHGMDDSKYSEEGLKLIEEMMMAGLGQQQLISAGGRPAIWADHPNARVFLALRGFAMKQQAVALRNTLQNIQEGNIEEAKDYAIRYAIFSMGAFAAINEGRQVLFGDGEPSAQRVQRSFFDQLVGVISLNSASVNDYSWGKLQRGEFLSYIVDNNTPIAIGVPAEAVQDVLDTLMGDKEIGELPNTLPLIKQGRNAITNFQEASSN